MLTKKLLSTNTKFPDDLKVSKIKNLPEKVLQFGEGNFLRAFIDWMIHQLNKNNLFNGKVVVAQPIPKGLIETINQQDGLYTLILRGIQNGNVVEKKEIISSISRGINPYENWNDFLKCAENPELRFIISNTTEAGITYLKEDYMEGKVLNSYPAKLTAFLYHRFKHFSGDPNRGMLVFPCELIDRNGDKLKSIIQRLIKEWELPIEFAKWVNEDNNFFNTLVDRIVTGYPRDDAKKHEQHFGYEDKLIDVGEIFHLWVIQGDKRFRKELPFHDIGLNVIWVDDLSVYRERKVRILNGAHTMTVPIAYLHGIETVKEAVDDSLVGKFMRKGIFEEILPMLKLPEEEKNSFANSVIERFQNPFIRHRLIDISLNSISKFKTRCLPTIIDYVEHYKKIPVIMSFSLAALIAFYKGIRIDNNKMLATRTNGEYYISDNINVLEFFKSTWETYNQDNKETLKKVVNTIFENKDFWGRDLSKLPNLNNHVYNCLDMIINQGTDKALEHITEK